MLYKYIDGDNMDEVKMNMTAPVVTMFRPEEGFRSAQKDFTVAFYLPCKYQVRPEGVCNAH